MTNRDEQLCLKAQSGDLNAASELATLYYERIFSYLRRLCEKDEDAADLTQKTFFKAWVSLASFENRSSFSTWIHGIAHHVYVDWRRKADRLDFPAEEWWDTCASEGSGPFEDAAQKEQAHQLYAGVERLDEDARQAVHLHYYQGLSLKETAEALGIAGSTLKYRLRAALDFLKSQTAEPRFKVR